MWNKVKLLSFKTGIAFTKTKTTKNKQLYFTSPGSHSDEGLPPSGCFLEVLKIELGFDLLQFRTSCLYFLLSDSSINALIQLAL